MLSAYMGRAFLNMLSLSLSGALIGAMILVIHPLTGKFFSKKWNYYIWLVVLIRLLVPVQVTASLPGGIELDMSYIRSEKADMGAMKSMTGDMLKVSGNILEGVTEDPSDNKMENTVEVMPGDITADIADSTGEDLREGGESRQSRLLAMESAEQNLRLDDTLLAALFFGAELLWLAGFFTALFMKLWHYRRFVLFIRKDIKPVTDSRITVLAQSLAVRLHMRKVPPIYTSASVSGPVTVGLWKPCIILPVTIPVTQYQLILHHEFVHVARRDLWFKWLYQLLFCIHWFNPLFYLFDRKMNVDCELSCDEAVLSMLTQEGRKAYGNVLLDIAEQNAITVKSAFSTTFVTGSSELKRRLHNVLTFQKPTILKILLSICVMTGTMFLTACGSVYLSYDSFEEDFEENDSFGRGGNSDKEGDAWKCYDDDVLLAGGDISDKWQAYLYSGGGNKVSISRFALNGSDSLRIVYADKDTDIEVTSEFDLKEGKFKIVHIAPDGSVSVINDTGEKGSQTVTMQTGRNVIKMVGQDAALKNAEISFSGLKERYFEAVYYSEEDEYAGQISDAIQDGTVEKDKVMESIYYMEQEDISEAFAVLLKKGTVFDDEELSDIFIYSDMARSGDYLVEAIDSGLVEPLSVDTLSDLVPFLEDKTTVGLLKTLPAEDFVEGLTECMPYLGEKELEDCLLAYIDAGGRLSYAQFDEIEMFLDKSTIKKLDERMSGN